MITLKSRAVAFFPYDRVFNRALLDLELAEDLELSIGGVEALFELVQFALKR